jgi:hypothetical protein
MNPPDYAPLGIADTWKGNHHGEPVCIKAIRTQDLIRLRGMERVCGSFMLPEAHSVRFIPDIPS